MLSPVYICYSFNFNYDKTQPYSCQMGIALNQNNLTGIGVRACFTE